MVAYIKGTVLYPNTVMISGKLTPAELSLSFFPFFLSFFAGFLSFFLFCLTFGRVVLPWTKFRERERERVKLWWNNGLLIILGVAVGIIYKYARLFVDPLKWESDARLHNRALSDALSDALYLYWPSINMKLLSWSDVHTYKKHDYGVAPNIVTESTNVARKFGWKEMMDS